MKKTPESIKKKYEEKLRILTANRERQTKEVIKRLEERVITRSKEELERRKAKLERASKAYINKKATEYKRRCANEIRELEGKPQREYKDKGKTRSQKLQIALAIAQENARLRDTDANGEGYCISCNHKHTWEELAGGHLFSRKLQSICLRAENINAQCHNCNYIMGPKGNTVERLATEAKYKENVIKKYGENILAGMETRVAQEIKNPALYKLTEPFLNELVPDLIDQNEELRKSKNFYKPAKNRRRIHAKYFTS